MTLLAYTPKPETKVEDKMVAGTKHPYRCQCGQVLFKAYRKPVGLQIKCPRCKAINEY